MSINIYTDGACSGNPGVGGWGVIIIENEKKVFLTGGLSSTTNNQMELLAAINALKFFKYKKKLNIYTDSKYVKDGITLWIKKWEHNGWKTANKKPVKNKSLWIELNNEIKKHEVEWKWVKGHGGNKYNEKADQLAQKYIIVNANTS